MQIYDYADLQLPMLAARYKKRVKGCPAMVIVGGASEWGDFVRNIVQANASCRDWIEFER